MPSGPGKAFSLPDAGQDKVFLPLGQSDFAFEKMWSSFNESGFPLGQCGFPSGTKWFCFQADISVIDFSIDASPCFGGLGNILEVLGASSNRISKKMDISRSDQFFPLMRVHNMFDVSHSDYIFSSCQMKMLLQSGADWNVPDSQGITPLSVASSDDLDKLTR